MAVWQDYAGKFSPLKATTFALVFVPALILAVEFFTNSLGGRPVTEVIHGLGDWTIRFLLLTLAVTPARTVLDWPRVLLLRRLLGVTTACYVVAHVFMYVVDSNFHMLFVISEIIRRFYLTIGFVAVIGLLILAITSTDGWQKSLGRKWKQLHRIVYPLATLGLFHYYIQSKANVSDAVFASGLFFWLMLWRLAPRRWQGKLWLLPVLAILAALTTAGAEAAWYAATAPRISTQRILLANLYVFYQLRPATEVLIWGLVLSIAATARRLIAPRRRAMVRKPA